MKCAICGNQVQSTTEAIEAGWIPEFYLTEESAHPDGPACSCCAQTHLELDAGGEFILRKSFA